MMQLLACQAISDRIVRVDADFHLDDVAEEISARQATHAAVFEGERFRGIVALNSLSAAQRIFGDLLPRREVHSVASETPITTVVHQMGTALLEGVAVLDPAGNFLGIVTQDSLMRCLLVDSQERLDEIERLKMQQERLRVVGQMACGMAHELNNALTPILGYLSLLQLKNELADDTSSQIDLVLTAAQDAAATVRRLQSFYRPARAPDSKGLVDIRVLLSEVEALTRPRWSDEAQASGSTIDFILDGEPSLWVKGNCGSLRELFTNFVFNAVDSMPVGGQIRVKSYARASHVVVEVTDTGCGMSEEQRQRRFEPFYTTKGDRGTGLGLSICQEIILDHCGRLEVESEYGHGSTFRVLFPVESQASAEELLPNTVSLLPWRILYVDDDKRSRHVVMRLLEFLRQEVDVADDAEAALQLFRKTRYDMVLTDLTMPNVNGITFTREIRQIHYGMPVVLLTGWVCSLASLGGPAESRPDAVLQKPLTVQALRSVLEQMQRGSSVD